MVEYKILFGFSLQISPEMCLVLRINERDMIKNVYWASCKVPATLVHFIETWIFWTKISKNTQNEIVVKGRHGLRGYTDADM